VPKPADFCSSPSKHLKALVLLLVVSPLAAQPVEEVPEDFELYEIDAGASDVHWLVYRAGAFSRFGHNHVISVGEMTGRVLVHPELHQSTFEIEIPVAALVVDDPALRAELGEEFDSVPTAEDVAGTRTNMLSPSVLDGSDHPVLRITGTGPSGERGSETLDVTIEILGRLIPAVLPTTVSLDGDTLEAAGEFRLTHEQLGMKPFSVMMGALQVGEPLDFTYRLSARRVQ
jgi:hypothetical protein